MGWLFPPNNGGQEQGFHDAGVETFRGNTDAFLAREALQNALDAKRIGSEEPVRVEFSIFTLNHSDLPGCKELLQALKASEIASGSDQEAVDFFRNAQKVLGRKIPILRIADYGTTGITGPPLVRESNWYNLVRRTGSSYKLGGQGGSFGIGKNAPFAASSLRTVFYSTVNKEQESLFQGVAKLVTHEAKDESLLQAVGFYGDAKGMAISDGSVPPPFQRTEQGADIFVIGYLGEGQWVEDLSRSVLEYFWPAILSGGLVVKVGDRNIDKDSLDQLMREAQDLPARYFYQATVDESAKTFSEGLDHLGPVQLRLLPGSDSYPNEVAMVRKTGMVVYLKAFRSLIRFAGLFVCDNDAGNELLRKMEPPSHDKWDGDRPSKGANTRVLNELTRWIRDCVKTLRPKIDTKPVSVPGLYKYLPDHGILEQTELSFGSAGGPPIKEETASVSSSSVPVVCKPIHVNPKTLPKAQKPEDEDDDNDDVEEGTDKPKKKKLSPKPGSDNNLQESIKMRCRIFLQSGSTNTYRVIAHPEISSPATADLIFGAVGDDGTSTPLRIVRAASLPDRTPLSTKPPNRITNVHFQPGQPAHYEIVVSDNMRYAMEISAFYNS